MNQYDSYKQSRRDGWGRIPLHWKEKRLKDCATLILGQSPDSESYNLTGKGIPFFQGNADFGRLHPKVRVWCDDPVKIAEENDILISVRAPVGELNFCQEKSCIGRGLAAIRSNHISHTYAYYFLQATKKHLHSLSTGTTFDAISGEDLATLPLLVPTSDEQSYIYLYLDKKISQIDQLITNKRQQIKKLNELRQITISRAVTQGLNPDVSMKDSGIEWLGKIPAHWKVRRIKDISLLLQTGPFGSQLHSEEYIKDGIPVINPSHLIKGKIIPDVDVTVDEATKEKLSRHMLETDDIVFARRGEMGRCALVTKKQSGWLCGTGSLLFRPNIHRSFPPYHSFVLSSQGVKEWLELRSVGSTMDNLNTEILGDIPLPLPPVSEQEEIFGFIKKEAIKFDSLVSNFEQQIQKLEELRKITIHNAVTGKIKVTD